MTESPLISVEGIAAAVSTREISAAEVIEASLARIEETEPRVGAFLALDPDGARAAARDLDERLARGEKVGRLAGVPFAVKDNLSVEGWQLTCASRILAGYEAPFTATAVRRCLAEGAILVGKTNLDEFAMGSSCENSALGTTRNPWDLDRVPGGSSGGSAAAVAAGCVPLALGSDTGGSVRQPAAFCGVVGLKPTYGRVSRYGLVAFASSLDQVGPLTRNVRDTGLALEVLSGADPRDATTAELAPPSVLAAIEEGLSGVRVGILREIPASRLDVDLRTVWEQSLDRLQRLGAEIVEVSIPNLEAAIATYYVLANSEASTNLARFDGVRYGLRVEAASLRDTYRKSRGAGFGGEVKRRIMLGTHALSSGYHEAFYGRAKSVAAGLREQLDGQLRNVQVLATPTAPSAAFPRGAKVDDPLAMYLSDVFTTPANLAGLPAVAVPAGLDAAGLPLSLQLMGARFEEALLLRAARAFERDLGFRVAPEFRGARDAA